MGSIYRPKFRAADGTLKLQTRWWLKYRDALAWCAARPPRPRRRARPGA